MLSNIIYCENLQNAIVSQPVNIISNLAFFVAALILFFELKNKNKGTLQLKIFIILIGLIGIGSIIWHIYPNDITIYFDVFPIVLFSLIFAYYLILKITGNKKYAKIGLGALLIYISICSIILRNYFHSKFVNGAYEYLLLILLFVMILIYCYFKKSPLFKYLLILSILFTVALFFRQIDLIICGHRRSGTHFLWHIINSVAIYFSAKLFIE